MRSNLFDFQKNNSSNLRQTRFGSPHEDILSHIPNQKVIGFKNLSSIGNSQENSPLLFATSLPANVIRHESVRSLAPAESPKTSTFSFENVESSNYPKTFPSAIVNGMILDVNEIVKDVVLNRPPSQQSFSSNEQKSHICPISYVPISCPVRGEMCCHAQCFDLRSFLISQEVDNWKCPICKSDLTIESLRFDPNYFDEKPGANDFIRLDLTSDLQFLPFERQYE